MEDRVRLHVIEQELDDTSPSGPHRSSRQRLNREKGRILRRIRGRDPRYFAVGKRGGGVPPERMGLLLLKKSVVKILEELEV